MTKSSLKDQCVVIGCSDTFSACDHSLHHNFFSIDRSITVKPDHCMDITREKLPKDLQKKFYLTLTENLDCMAYSIFTGSRSMLEDEDNPGWKGLKTILDLTRKDGFILIFGCPRQFDYRCTISKKMKYIEITPDDVLIPVDQDQDIDAINQQIAASEILRTVIQKVKKIREADPELFEVKEEEEIKREYDIFEFCTLDCASFPTVREFSKAEDRRRAEKIGAAIARYPAFKELFNVIGEMDKHGEKIIKEVGNNSTDIAAGRQFVRLSREIKLMANNFLSQDADNIDEKKIEKFCKSVTEKIGNPHYSHRKFWKVIAANLAFALTALTGIGAAVLLVYSKRTTGHWAGLFKQKTHREQLSDKCLQATAELRKK